MCAPKNYDITREEALKIFDDQTHSNVENIVYAIENMECTRDMDMILRVFDYQPSESIRDNARYYLKALAKNPCIDMLLFTNEGHIKSLLLIVTAYPHLSVRDVYDSYEGKTLSIGRLQMAIRIIKEAQLGKITNKFLLCVAQLESHTTNNDDNDETSYDY